MLAILTVTLVVCAPGYPGSAAEAQPAMDALARARAAAPGLPADVEIVASSAVLSALRRAANGEKVAVLLDGAQSAALGKLPFAASLAVVESSPPMPVAVISTLDKRIDERRRKTLQPAFTPLSGDPSAPEALDAAPMPPFVPPAPN